MKILFIGDIVGKPGRNIAKSLLPQIIDTYKVQCVIANGENTAGGFGITAKIARELFESNIDVLTTGNHVWDKKEIYDYIDYTSNLLRPANYPSGVPGKGYTIISLKDNPDIKVGVINVSGRVFMQPLDCPFMVADKILKEMHKETPIIVVDMHAEATSEKMAFGYYLDGKVSAVIGTHTHVQTSDERLLPQGTAYITDAGMCGVIESVIGINKDNIIKKYLTAMPERFKLAKGKSAFNGVLVDIDNNTGKALSILRLIKIQEE